MLTAATNKCYVLECRRGPNVHYIPIPGPSRSEIYANPLATSKDAKRVLVACPECGLVSAYSESDVQVQMSPSGDPFEADIRRLVSLQVECDDRNCDTPRSIRTILENDRGTWTQRVLPRDWTFSSECLCQSGHRLAPNWEENHVAWTHHTLLF
jgi:hypothetical protein